MIWWYIINKRKRAIYRNNILYSYFCIVDFFLINTDFNNGCTIRYCIR